MKHAVLSVVMALTAAFPRATAAPDCAGCVPSATASAAGSGAAGIVTITVTVISGTCVAGGGSCVGALGKVSIDRAWAGVAPNTAVNHCIVVNGIRRCEDPAPSSGSTGGGTSNRSDDIKCGSDAYYTISVGHGTGLVLAGASGSCTACQ